MPGTPTQHVPTLDAPAAAPPGPASRAEPPGDSTPGDPIFRISLDLYHRMAEQGMITTHDRIELLDGILVRKMTKGPRHVLSTELLRDDLPRILPQGYSVRQEAPISLPGGEFGPDSEPEPDISVVRGVRADFSRRHPRPDETLLVVEVADSSVREDRAGLARYARAGIPEAWVVNLADEVLERYTEPTGPAPEPRYLRSETLRRGDRIEVIAGGVALAGDIEVAAILPPADES